MTLYILKELPKEKKLRTLEDALDKQTFRREGYNSCLSTLKTNAVEELKERLKECRKELHKMNHIVRHDRFLKRWGDKHK